MCGPWCYQKSYVKSMICAATGYIGKEASFEVLTVAGLITARETLKASVSILLVPLKKQSRQEAFEESP